MTNIIEFNAKKPRNRGVFCNVLGVYFPELAKVTQEYPDGFDFASVEMKPCKSSTIHCFDNDEQMFPFLTEKRLIRTLSEDDKFSLVVRRHDSVDAACKYRAGLYDFGADLVVSFEIAFGEGGAFTLMHRPLSAKYPAPTITYIAEYDDQNSPVGVTDWILTVGTDGEFYVEDSRVGDDANLSSLIPIFSEV